VPSHRVVENGVDQGPVEIEQHSRRVGGRIGHDNPSFRSGPVSVPRPLAGKRRHPHFRRQPVWIARHPLRVTATDRISTKEW
jgi:hypothetical protein